jgi:hypothetical protein
MSTYAKKKPIVLAEDESSQQLKQQKRKKPLDNRTAMRWVIESIQKVLDEREQQAFASSASVTKSSSERTNLSYSPDDRKALFHVLYQIPKGRCICLCLF